MFRDHLPTSVDVDPDSGRVSHVWPQNREFVPGLFAVDLDIQRMAGDPGLRVPGTPQEEAPRTAVRAGRLLPLREHLAVADGGRKQVYKRPFAPGLQMHLSVISRYECG